MPEKMGPDPDVGQEAQELFDEHKAAVIRQEKTEAALEDVEPKGVMEHSEDDLDKIIESGAAKDAYDANLWRAQERKEANLEEYRQNASDSMEADTGERPNIDSDK